MFKFPNSELSPPLLWCKSLTFYKCHIMNTWYWFFIFSLVPNFPWYILDKHSLANQPITIESMVNYQHSISAIDFFLVPLFYLGIIYLCFLGLVIIYSKSKNGESYRGQINYTIFRVCGKIIFATILFIYVYVGFPGAFVGYFSSRLLGAILGDWMIVINSSYWSALCGLLMWGVSSACASVFIFYCIIILFSGRNVVANESIIESFNLVRGSFWRNFFVLIPYALLLYGIFYCGFLLFDYIKTQLGNNLVSEISIMILKSMCVAWLIPAFMSLLLIQYNDLEIRKMHH